MATLITKNSQTANAVPSAASLAVGELAVNTADGKLYTEHTGGVVKEIIPSTVVDGGITTAKIADGAVTSAKIADGTIATGDIADSAITTAKIANANVTIGKLSASGTPSSSTFLRGDNTWATVSAGISAQNCSYTGSLVESGGGSITSSSFTIDLGSNRVVTGIRFAFIAGAYSNSTNCWIRGYNIKNTA